MPRPLPVPAQTPPNWGQQLLNAVNDMARPGLKVALLGASITQETSTGAGVYDTPVASAWFHAFGAFSWANVRLGHRLTLVKNAGVAGQRSDHIAARLTDVTGLAVVPDWCIVADWFTNDVLTDTNTAAQIKAQGELIVSGLLAAGLKVVLCTGNPTAGFTTSGRKATVSQVNAWVRAQATRPGVVVCDAAPLMAQPADGLPRTNMLRDGTHHSGLGGYTAGKALAAALAPFVGGAVDLPTSNVDSLSLNSNPMMLGTAGTKPGSITGNVADAWDATWSGAAGTAVASKVARADGVGEWQQLQITAAGTIWLNIGALTTGWAVGDRLCFEADFELDAGSTGLKMLNAFAFLSTGAFPALDLYQTESPPPTLPAEALTGVLRTPEFTMPAGPTWVYGAVGIQATTATLRVGRARLKKVI